MGMGAQGVTSGATQTQREVIVENVEEKVAEQEVAASSQTQQEESAFIFTLIRKNFIYL